jgi:anthranilate synthase component 1
MHIVSQVDGVLDKDKTALDALLAGFPAGTLTGAPKIRAMQIIDMLETEKRSIYAGCIGYLGVNGEFDSCIALRMAVIKENIAYIQAGAGIVADSVPEKEYEECLNKARALLKAAQSL